MGIEIRPAGMLAMLDEKAEKLDQMKEAFVSSKQGMTQFIADENLQGEAFSAAKNRMSNWLLVLESYETFIDRSKQIDNQLKGIISGTFGSLTEVSEDYWLSEVNRIKSEMDYYNGLADKIERNATEELTTSEKTRVKNYRGNAKLLAKGQLQHAEDMLSDIRNYVAQTDNLYCDSDFAALDSSIDRAIKAITQASFDPKTNKWKKMDTSWVNDLKKNNANVRDTYYIELSKDGESFAIVGNFAYVNGKKYNLLDNDAFQIVSGVLSNNKMWNELASNAGTTAEELLRAVGIAENGTVTISGDYCTFKDFKMAAGAQKMTTRCRVDNIKSLSRPNASFSSAKWAKFGKIAKGFGKVSGPISFATGGLSAIDAYNEEYEAGAGLTEDQRRTNATVAAGIDVGKTAASTVAGTATFDALAPGLATVGTTICPGVGTAVGILVAGGISALVSFGVDKGLDAVI